MVWNDFLFLNARKGDAAILRALITSGCDPNTSNELDLTPLVCADFNEPEVVQVLLEAGADAKLLHRLGDNPLHLAVEANGYESVRLLLDLGCCDVNGLNRCGESPLRAAVKAGHNEIAALLIDKGAVVNEPRCDESIISLAARLLNEELTEYLLKQGADINYENEGGTTLLHYAVKFPRPRIARIVLKLGADIHKSDNFGLTPLHVAASDGNVALIELLLDHGANVSARIFNGNTPLRMATSSGLYNSYETIKVLLERGASCEDGRRLETTALYRALSHCDCRTIKLMMDFGANIWAESWRGFTALHYAAMNPRVVVVDFVIEQGFDVNARSSFHCTPLHVATKDGNNKICKYLVKKGADVNIKDRDNHTALYLAVVCQETELVEFYLEQGADMCVRIKSDGSIFEAALSRYDSDIVGHLIKYMARLVYMNKRDKVFESDLKIVEESANLKEFYAMCVNELDKMKMMILHEDVSLYDVLMVHEMARIYAKNEDLVSALDALEEKIEEEFPIYSELDMRRFSVEVRKQRLFRKGAIGLNNILKLNDPFHIVNLEILSYLDEADFESLEGSMYAE